MPSILVLMQNKLIAEETKQTLTPNSTTKVFQTSLWQASSKGRQAHSFRLAICKSSNSSYDLRVLACALFYELLQLRRENLHSSTRAENSLFSIADLPHSFSLLLFFDLSTSYFFGLIWFLQILLDIQLTTKSRSCDLLLDGT